MHVTEEKKVDIREIKSPCRICKVVSNAYQKHRCIEALWCENAMSCDNGRHCVQCHSTK